MTENTVERKLRAILCADVKGYSRMMGEDEVGTYQTLTVNLKSIRSIISEHKGRVFSSPGDAVMAEFSSVVNAVQCAVELQDKIEATNADVPENQKMQFRIGVNLGDVIHDGEQVYGDGINIAARIETLAEPGGVSISRNVYNNVQNKLKFGYEYKGEHQVKNIAEPVRVYKVLTEPEYAGKLIGERPKTSAKKWALPLTVAVIVLLAITGWLTYQKIISPEFEPASIDEMAYPLPVEPSIAVLPFDNMSGDPDQEYLADGITENIIAALSNIRKMFVIARNSTFAYKGKSAKIQQIAEELGVRYVLEGSIQKSEDRLRITAQLIDAITGKHLWAERYDRDLKDLFALQDEITMKIIGALRVKLTEGERTNIAVAGTDNLRAYLKLMQASKQRNRWNKEGIALSHKLAEEAITLDPEYADAYLSLSANHLMDMMYGTSESPEQSLKKAEELVQKAISLRGGYADARAFLGRIYVTKRQYDLAIAEGERAVALAPNSSFVHAALAFSLGYAGRPEEAIPLFKKAIRLSPIADSWYLARLGMCYSIMGRYEEAISALTKAIKLSPNAVNYHAGQAANYVLAGHMEKAQTEAAEVLRIDHKFSLERWRKGQLYKDEAYLEELIGAMRKAGLPDKPPLPLPDKPSIAVLPFDNMSGDPEQEYIADGITESIISALSKIEDMLVIARNSTFTYKGKPVKVQQVSEELGVRNVLEGSTQKIGDRVRITAQLINATTGHHLWSEKYDREMKDLFALQDEITLAIIRAMRVELTEGKQASVTGRGTEILEAYLKAMQAQKQFYLMTKEGSMEAKKMAKVAIALDPNYAFPYATLANAHMLDVWFKFSASSKESMRLAAEAAQKALTLDASDPRVYAALTNLYIMQRQYEKAINAAEHRLELSPSGAQAYNSMGLALSFAGRYSEAIPFIEQAIRLDPYPPSVTFRTLGDAYRGAGRYEEAVTEYKKALQQNPDDIFTHLDLADTYMKLGREVEARAEAGEVIRIHPKFSLSHYAKSVHEKDRSDLNDYIERLRKAGLPD